MPIAATVARVALIAALSVGYLRLDSGHPSRSSYIVPDPSRRRELLIAVGVVGWRDRRRPTDLAWSATAGIALDVLAQDVDHFRHCWLLLGLLVRGTPRLPWNRPVGSDRSWRQGGELVQ